MNVRMVSAAKMSSVPQSFQYKKIRNRVTPYSMMTREYLDTTPQNGAFLPHLYGLLTAPGWRDTPSIDVTVLVYECMMGANGHK